MKARILILLSLILACLPGPAQTIRITGFDDLMTALNSGERVRVVIHWAKCKKTESSEGQLTVPDAITGMDIDTYEYFAAGAIRNKSAFVVFSDSKLIQKPMGKGFVYNYGKIRINADNTVQITSRYIHPRKFRILMDEKYSGEISNGLNEGGINLFK